jgi:hypothetical protein
LLKAGPLSKKLLGIGFKKSGVFAVVGGCRFFSSGMLKNRKGSDLVLESARWSSAAAYERDERRMMSLNRRADDGDGMHWSSTGARRAGKGLETVGR